MALKADTQMSNKPANLKGNPSKATAEPAKTIFREQKTLEWILKALLIAQSIWVISIYWSEPQTLAIFAFLFLLVHAFVKGVKYGSGRVGRYISTKLFELGMVSHRPLHAKAQLSKWQDQMWQFAIHVSMSLFELFVLWDEDWWNHMETAWIPGPEEYSRNPKLSLTILYLTQLAIWIYTCYMHAYEPVRNRRKDYYVMFTHHIITITLVAGSAQSHFERIGLLVLYVHDVSDIFIDLLKLTNYTKSDGKRGLFIVELSFAATYISWIYYRLYIFPFHVIPSAFVSSKKVLFPNEPISKALWGQPSMLSALNLHSYLLMSLACMHVYWFYTLSKILYKILFATSREASRTEYEGQSSEDEATPQSTSKSVMTTDTADRSTRRRSNRRAT